MESKKRLTNKRQRAVGKLCVWIKWKMEKGYVYDYIGNRQIRNLKNICSI